MKTIQTKAKSKRDFYLAFKSKVKPGSKFTEKTSLVYSIDAFLNWDSIYGEIDEYSFWIIKPHPLRLSFSQRVFRGDYSEENGTVVVVGSFEFAEHARAWNIFFGVLATFFAFLIFRIADYHALLSLLLALCIGAAAWGLLTGADLLTSRSCEKDIINLLSSLG